MNLLEISLVFLDVSLDKRLEKYPIFLLHLRPLKGIVIAISSLVLNVKQADTANYLGKNNQATVCDCDIML